MAESYLETRARQAKLAELKRQGATDDQAEKIVGTAEKATSSANRTQALSMLIGGTLLALIGVARIVSDYAITEGEISPKGIGVTIGGVGLLTVGIQRWRHPSAPRV